MVRWAMMVRWAIVRWAMVWWAMVRWAMMRWWMVSVRWRSVSVGWRSVSVGWRSVSVRWRIVSVRWRSVSVRWRSVSVGWRTTSVSTSMSTSASASPPFSCRCCGCPSFDICPIQFPFAGITPVGECVTSVVSSVSAVVFPVADHGALVSAIFQVVSFVQTALVLGTSVVLLNVRVVGPRRFSTSGSLFPQNLQFPSPDLSTFPVGRGLLPVVSHLTSVYLQFSQRDIPILEGYSPLLPVLASSCLGSGNILLPVPTFLTNGELEEHDSYDHKE